MIAILAALAAAAAPAPANETCALAHPEACGDTSQLFGDKAFVARIKAFVGRGEADYLYPASLAEQQLAVLGGPPDAPERIGGLYRFTACRQHSCAEKGAVVLDPTGRLVATAILHSACAVTRPTEDCSTHYVLSVFVSDPSASKPVVDDLGAWAGTKVRSLVWLGSRPPTLDGVEVFAVINGKRKRVSAP